MLEELIDLRSFQLFLHTDFKMLPTILKETQTLILHIVNSFELGYNYSKGNKLTINPTLYYQITNDDINFTVTKDTEKLCIYARNLGTEDRYGMDFNYNITATKWLRVFGNFNLFGYKMNLNLIT